MTPTTSKQVFLFGAIVFIALCLFLAVKNVPAIVNAQNEPAAPENSITVVPVQIDRDTHGLAMIDNVAKTLWIYKLDNRGPAFNRLELFAARSWAYDRMLHQYNTAEPKPEQVKIILENLSRPRDNEKQKDINVKPKNISNKPKDADDKPRDVNDKPKDVNEK
jgi:hypothetical protein